MDSSPSPSSRVSPSPSSRVPEILITIPLLWRQLEDEGETEDALVVRPQVLLTREAEDGDFYLPNSLDSSPTLPDLLLTSDSQSSGSEQVDSLLNSSGQQSDQIDSLSNSSGQQSEQIDSLSNSSGQQSEEAGVESSEEEEQQVRLTARVEALEVSGDSRRNGARERKDRQAERKDRQSEKIGEILSCLSDCLECPVCYSLQSLGPVFQCELGHVICSMCLARLATCPMCRKSFRFRSPVRNLALEKLAKFV